MTNSPSDNVIQFSKTANVPQCIARVSSVREQKANPVGGVRSFDWKASGKRLRMTRAALGVSDDPVDEPESGQPPPVAWELARPDDPDVPPVQHRLLRAISARIQNRAAIDAARARERSVTALADVSANTDTKATQHGEEGER